VRRAALLLLLLVGAAGCGGGGDGPVNTEDARRAVEQASGLKVRALDPPEPEVKTMFAATGKGQFVQLFVMTSAENARTLGEKAPATSVVKTLAHRNLFVVASGSKAAAVIRAVEKL
jgi:hypothetical protein